MFDNVFDGVLYEQHLRETYGHTAADVQRIYDGVLKQGVGPLNAISETEMLCNIRGLVIAHGKVAAFRSN